MQCRIRLELYSSYVCKLFIVTSGLVVKSYLDTIRPELPSKEDVHQVNVAEDVEEIETLREDKLDRPDVVAVEVVYQVLGQHLRAQGVE